MPSRVDKLETTEEKNRSSVTADIAYQPTSIDIWDKKYRLKSKDGAALDQSIDHTFKRIAKALADVEPPDIDR